MDEWFYVVLGQRNGPISQEMLIRKLREGQLGPDTLVWRTGVPDWQKASEMPELSPKAEPPPVPDTLQEKPDWKQVKFVWRDLEAQTSASASKTDEYVWRDHEAERAAWLSETSRGVTGTGKMAASSDTRSEPATRPNRNWGWTLIMVVSVIVVGSLGKVVGKVGSEAIFGAIDASSQPTLDQADEAALRQGLVFAEAETRKKLPLRVDETTTLSEARVIGNLIIYSMDLDAAAVQKAAVVAHSRDIESANRKRVCNTARTKKLIQAGAVMEWDYRINGEIVTSAIVSSCP